ncbi:MAG: carbohydrate ABC transporter permease [bacterium]
MVGEAVERDVRGARFLFSRYQLLKVGRSLSLLVLLIVGAVVMALPFCWLLSTSLKEDSQVWLFPPEWIPNPIAWRNYIDALTIFPFHIYFKNTFTITFLSVLGILLSSSFCAYGFARLRFPGRDFIFMIVLSTMMLPPIVLLIPQFIMFKYLGWVNTFRPLIVPAYFGGGAFNIFLLRQFFRAIPGELTDAARIDGCSELGVYWKIILPLSKPALTAVVIFAFLGHWNDFLGPLIYINSPEKFTVSLGLASFMDVYTTKWNFLMAASTVTITPVLILFFSAQRYFIRGVILTGLKG